MEDWKKSEGTFNLACDPQRASGMMQNTCVKIEHVTKRFGEDIVLQEVNLSLKTGNVYGIVGNNGSGKTVLMKCICGFLPVTTGTIFVFGKKIGHDVDFPESLGVIIETPGFLTQYTGFKNLEILADMNGRISKADIRIVLKRVGVLLAGMKEEKRQFTVLLPLGDLAYDEDFLQKAKKIKGIKEIWPVIEVPVVIKIEDYTETTTFSGIDMNAFGKNPTQNELGKMPLLLLGNGSLRDMKDYNNHAISKKQQEKFLEMGENLNIFYFLDEKEKDTSKATDDLTTLSGNSAREPQTSYMPCKAAVVIEGNEIYIPISQAQDLCREIGEPSEISKVYLKINGKNNLENAKKILSGI